MERGFFCAICLRILDKHARRPWHKHCAEKLRRERLADALRNVTGKQAEFMAECDEASKQRVWRRR